MKRTHFSALIPALVIAPVILLSCAKADRVQFAEAKSASFSGADGSPMMASAPERDSATTPAQSGRKLVYTADMALEAADMTAAENAVIAAVSKAGGYVSSRSGDEYGIFLQLRLPVPSLEPVMAAVSGEGKTLSRSLSAQDVTDEFFDLEGRLKNKRILEERYRDYLRQAKTVADMLDVEKRLSETTTEIESLEGSFRSLSKQIDLATLSVRIRPLYAVAKPGAGFVQSLANLFASFGAVMSTALVILLGIVLYGIPLLLITALVWLLAFGRVGLVRKLFTLVRSGKEASPK